MTVWIMKIDGAEGDEPTYLIFETEVEAEAARKAAMLYTENDITLYPRRSGDTI